MKLWIDCEWNSFGGDLISVALVSEDGKEFYEELHCNNPHEWIKQNVMPNLFKSKISYEDLQKNMQIFLNQFDSVHIIADWPEDIERFCKLLIVGAGLRLNTPPLTMEVVRIDAKSEVPHNALFDAEALRKEMT